MALKMPLRKRRQVEVGDDGLVRMSLVDHLAELRRRVMISTIAVTSGAVVGFLLYGQPLRELTAAAPPVEELSVEAGGRIGRAPEVDHTAGNPGRATLGIARR